MTTYKVLGYSPYTGTWVELGLVQANTMQGANQKAHKLFNQENAWVEFGIFATAA